MRTTHVGEEAIQVVNLSAVDGVSVRTEVLLSGLSTFRIGGPARWLVEVQTEKGLRSLRRLLADASVPAEIVGVGSNVLFPDAGFPGVILKLSGFFKRVRFAKSGVRAGAGVSLPQLAQRAARRGLTGLEPLSGFPSTVGGAVFMNAGCYGTEISSLLVRATLIGLRGERRVVGPSELEPSYRKTVLSETGEVVTGATFELIPGDADAALRRIKELNEKRWASLPAGVANAGSTFKNPADDYAGRLIEACGLKGRRLGGAEISEKHANVLVNRGGARADDVLGLMIEAAVAVRERFDVVLEPELVLVGDLRARFWKAVEG